MHGRDRSPTGEQRAIDAFFRLKEFHSGDGIDVEVRKMPPTTDPRSGRPVKVPPVVILWAQERPLAVRIRSVVALGRYGQLEELANVVEGLCDAYGLPLERVYEAALWRLFQHPPRMSIA